MLLRAGQQISSLSYTIIMKAINNYTPEFKAKVVMEILSEVSWLKKSIQILGPDWKKKCVDFGDSALTISRQAEFFGINHSKYCECERNSVK